MLKSRIVMLGLVLVIAGCGGGGPGGGSSGGGTGSGGKSNQKGATDLGSDDLTGTWLKTTVYYEDPTNTGSYQWVNTVRQSIVVKDDKSLIFKDCVAGNSVAAIKNGNNVEFTSPGNSTLAFVDADTLQANVTCDTCTPHSRTELELHRVSTETTISQAAISLDQPFAENDWDQVCVKTIVDNSQDNSVQVKASKLLEGISVNMTLTDSSPIQQGTYSFPGGSATIDASLGTLLGTTKLINPNGTIVVTEGATIDFQADLTLQYASDSSYVAVSGLISFDPQWFAGQ